MKSYKDKQFGATILNRKDVGKIRADTVLFTVPSIQGEDIPYVFGTFVNLDGYLDIKMINADTNEVLDDGSEEAEPLIDIYIDFLEERIDHDGSK